MKKYVVAGSVLAVSLFIMNGGGMIIGLGIAHLIAFLIKAILLVVFGYIGMVVLWRLVGSPLMGCAGVITVIGMLLWLVSLF